MNSFIESLDGNIATRKTNLKHLPSLQDFHLVSVAEDAESGYSPVSAQFLFFEYALLSVTCSVYLCSD